MFELEFPANALSVGGKATGSENRAVVVIPPLRLQPSDAGAFRLREGNVDQTDSRSKSARGIRGR